MVLEKTLESPLDCKGIQQVHPKGSQSWIVTGRRDAEAETLILWPHDAKNWCFWTVVLENTLESPLNCKGIQPVYSEGDQPWDFFGRNDAKAEAPVLWPPHAKSWLIGKDSCWEVPGSSPGGSRVIRRWGRSRRLWKNTYLITDIERLEMDKCSRKISGEKEAE